MRRFLDSYIQSKLFLKLSVDIRLRSRVYKKLKLIQNFKTATMSLFVIIIIYGLTTTRGIQKKAIFRTNVY